MCVRCPQEGPARRLDDMHTVFQQYSLVESMLAKQAKYCLFHVEQEGHKFCHARH
jgi:hypothetical protein